MVTGLTAVFVLLVAVHCRSVQEHQGETYVLQVSNQPDGDLWEEVRVDRENKDVIINTYSRIDAVQPDYIFRVNRDTKDLLVFLPSTKLCFLYKITEDDFDQQHFLPEAVDFEDHETFAQMMQEKILDGLLSYDWMTTAGSGDLTNMDSKMAAQCADSALFGLMKKDKEISDLESLSHKRDKRWISWVVSIVVSKAADKAIDKAIRDIKKIF